MTETETDAAQARSFALDRFREILIVIAGASKRGESSDPETDETLRQYVQDIAKVVEAGNSTEAVRRLMILADQIPKQHITGLHGSEATRWRTVVLRLGEARVALEDCP